MVLTPMTAEHNVLVALNKDIGGNVRNTLKNEIEKIHQTDHVGLSNPVYIQDCVVFQAYDIPSPVSLNSLAYHFEAKTCLECMTEMNGENDLMITIGTFPSLKDHYSFLLPVKFLSLNNDLVYLDLHEIGKEGYDENALKQVQPDYGEYLDFFMRLDPKEQQRVAFQCQPFGSPCSASFLKNVLRMKYGMNG